jgi:thiol:disulfide interchange protein DsbC
MLRRFIVMLWVAAGLAMLTGAAPAPETLVRAAFQTKFPELAIESVGRSAMPALYEVVADGQIFYVDESVNFVVRGVLFDARAGALRNVTAERTAQLNSQALTRAQDLAVRRVRGNGKRVVYTFEDPNCGYCKALQKELVKLNDVTIYTFLLPIVSPPDSVEKSKAVWCAKDRGRAWDDLMLKGVALTVPKGCEPSFEKTVELAERFNIRGTPAVYLGNGQQIGGFVAADKIEQALKTLK